MEVHIQRIPKENTGTVQQQRLILDSLRTSEVIRTTVGGAAKIFLFFFTPRG